MVQKSQKPQKQTEIARCKFTQNTKSDY